MKGKDFLRRHELPATATVRDALEGLNRLSGETMTLFVADGEGRVSGSVTDGDVRRGLLAGIGLVDPVARVAHTGFLAVKGEDSDFEVMRRAREKGIALLPRLDQDGRLAGIIDLREIKALLPIDAVLMAGGRGERLRPLTLDTPKPLLEVGGRAIIDYNIDSLKAHGVADIFVTVNHLREKIEAHFEAIEGVECIAEPRRLGTIGSLRLIGDRLRHDNVLVMNSDLLTDLDFEDLYSSHVASGAALTVVAVPYTVSVPFAVMDIKGEWVNGLTEKPTLNYFVNAGVYLMRRELVERIAPDSYTDAPDFIEDLIADGKKVGYYHLRGTWIDIGSPDDYRHACEMMKAPRLGHKH